MAASVADCGGLGAANMGLLCVTQCMDLLMIQLVQSGLLRMRRSGNGRLLGGDTIDVSNGMR